MSNGGTPCPTITLPFGVFPDTPTIDELDPTAFSSDTSGPGLEEYILGHSPDDATDTDGFNEVFDETVAIVDSFDNALGLLGSPAPGDLDDTFEEILTLDAGPVGDTLTGFVGSIDPSSAATDDLGTLLAGGAPGPAPSGGAPPPPPAVTIINEGDVLHGSGVVQLPLEYDNHTAATVTITQITFTPLATSADPKAWRFPALTFPRVVPPGGKDTFTVGIETSVLGEDFAEMIVAADHTPPAGDYRLVANVTDTPAQPPPRGSPDGGIHRRL